MPLALLEHVSWVDVLVPLGSVLLGAVLGAGGARYLRRQEFYADAAQKINDYIDEAVAAKNAIDQQAPFNIELLDRVRKPVNMARFHSERLECQEVTNRLSVAGLVLTNVITNESYEGLRWVDKSIDDVMAAVVRFMILPRFWPPWRWGRHIPPNWFPNTEEQYKELATWDDKTQKIGWAKLKEWDLEEQLKREKKSA